MSMDVFLLLGILILLFVAAVFRFGRKKRRTPMPKQWHWATTDNAEKGIAGEKAVSEILSRLPQYEYRVFNNVLLNNPLGGTTQIDHIVVSRFGVFVIETKNFGGKVYGRERARFWKEYFRGKEYKFYNPIRQNNTHIAVLRKNLASFFNVPFFSVVAFPPEAELRVSVNNGIEILYWNDLLDLFRQTKEERMSRPKTEALGFELNKVRIKKLEVLQMHATGVQAYVLKRKMAIREGICPCCGSKLVRRKGKFGEFFGCSSYPDCTFIWKINE